ncbi:Putative ATPase TraE [Staphylococcus aureus]|nr:Putative ATPase TraE [Staphylococcus aureus]CAC9010497.1 Putative ATPase TraE [Staphylococcus aureus]
MAFLKKKKQEQVTNKIHNESFQKLTEVLGFCCKVKKYS